MINRFSSRRSPLDASFLTSRLAGAQRYDRVAGYFSSSVLEMAGEALESVAGQIRVVCNSHLNPHDVATAKAAQVAMRQEWCGSEPEKFGVPAQLRFTRLYGFLRSGKLRVRVLPHERFGLLHGKAGVITMADGRQTTFLGSANETREGWQLHYELIWEDESPEAATWVQEEFDALWNHGDACDLADFVVEDIGRIAQRSVIPDVASWRTDADPAAAIVEAPVYRKEVGLWEHQKYFVKRAFEAHLTAEGARFVLADQVGLGKTIQLGMAAQLMALHTDKPVLVLAPKTLIWQWQGELTDMLDVPSAVWNGRQWVDENGIEHAAVGPAGLAACPRRIGIVSYGLISAKSPSAEFLKKQNYACVVVDEAHRARRRNLGQGAEDEKATPNNLMAFLQELAVQTHSLLLATATPVQMNPVEAHDLLDLLARGRVGVLGNRWSQWQNAGRALPVIMGKEPLPADPKDAWQWIRNPLPAKEEHQDIRVLRGRLGIGDDVIVPNQMVDEVFNGADWSRVGRLARTFGVELNPVIRHIIRRSRDYLENTIDPETGDPYLKPVSVDLRGERDEDAIPLPPYLEDAYRQAESFCKLLGGRVKAAGFLKTLLLRRLGSSIEAGRSTALRMLHEWEAIEDGGEEDDLAEEATSEAKAAGQGRALTGKERDELQLFVDLLNADQSGDPKYLMVRKLLLEEHWLDLGCIVFSQYFDSIQSLGEQLTAELPLEPIAYYAGGARSGVLTGGVFQATPRETIKARVKAGTIRLVLGTDAASEGLNLQRLGTLINLDLPWNPTRLEQRKGRIQRIGQLRDTVLIYNLRYKESVEDRVHQLLSQRLQDISSMFGQLPDVLEDAWVNVALGDIAKAKQTIDSVPAVHPFQVRCHEKVERVAWESCSTVLNQLERRKWLARGWKA